MWRGKTKEPINLKRKILIAPLDWGLGHATRCIPLIRHLLSQGHEVFIASSGAPQALLSQEFPDISFFPLPGYGVRYSRRLPMAISMALQSRNILRNIWKEKKWLEAHLLQNTYDLIISDNRYGFYADGIPSVLLTHQLQIQTSSQLSFLQPLLRWQVRHFARSFREIWVPDTYGNILSGKLSRANVHPNVQFIGPLSRFSRQEREKQYDVLFLISGPEPQRTVMEEIARREAVLMPELRIAIVLGRPGESGLEENASVKIFSHLNASELNELVESSSLIISRSGYSTVMDMARLGARVVWVPTPGQTEQEYLAHHLKERGYCYYLPQESFELKKAVKNALVYPGLQLKEADFFQFRKRLDEVLA